MGDLVSIIVPIYNVEKYLDRCLSSIVNQTYKNLEIILIDDGSPDSCPQMCDKWAEQDSRIKVIHKSNAGLGMARNTGIDNANGKYIFFLDSDDKVDVALVEKCVSSATCHHSEVVLFGRYNVYEDGRCIEKKVSEDKTVFENESIKNDLLPCLFTYELGFGVSAWGKMYDLDFLKSNQLRFKSEREIISEDSYFSLELFSKTSRVSVVAQCLYYYYKRGDSLSRAYKEGRQNQNDLFLEKSLEFVENNKLPQCVSVHIMSRYHGFTLGTLMQVSRSKLPKDKKREEIDKILKSLLLNQTLTDEVLRLDARFPRFLWKTLRLKLYPLCKLLLWCKVHKP